MRNFFTRKSSRNLAEVRWESATGLNQIPSLSYMLIQEETIYRSSSSNHRCHFVKTIAIVLSLLLIISLVLNYSHSKESSREPIVNNSTDADDSLPSPRPRMLSRFKVGALRSNRIPDDIEGVNIDLENEISKLYPFKFRTQSEIESIIEKLLENQHNRYHIPQ